MPIHSATDAGIRKITLANILSTFALTDMTMVYGTPPADWTTPGTVPTSHKPGHKVQFGGAFPTAALVKNHIATAIGGYMSVPSTSAFAGGAAGVTGQFYGGSSTTLGTGVLGAAYPNTGNTAGVQGSRGLGESCTQSRAAGSISCPGSTIANLALVTGGAFGTNNDSATTAARYSLVLTTAGTQPGVLDAAIGIPVVGAGVRKHIYGVRFDAGSVDYAMRVGPVDTGVSKASAAIRLVGVDGAGAEKTVAVDVTAAGVLRFLVPGTSHAIISDGTLTVQLPPNVLQNGIPLFSTGVPAMLSTTGTGDLMRSISPVITSPVIVDKTGMNHDHSTVANAGLLTETAFDAANKQGTGSTKFQMATTLAAGTGNPVCQDANGNTTMTCGGAASFATITGTTMGDFSAGALKVSVSASGAPAGECDEASEVGKIRVRSAVPETANGAMHICRQIAGTLTYGWQPVWGTLAATQPGKCAVGQLWFDSDATPGANLYGCTDIDTWTLLGGTGGSGGIISQDEGTQQGTAQTTVNFVGGGVLATSAGAVTTVTVPGGGVDKFVISTTAAGDLITLANSAPVSLKTATPSILSSRRVTALTCLLREHALRGCTNRAAY